MKAITSYLQQYFTEVNKPVLVLSALFLSILVFTNYYWGLENRFSIQPEVQQYLLWYILFLTVFIFPYLLYFVLLKKNYFRHWKFFILLLAAPAIFAWKMSANIHFDFTENKLMNAYWNLVLYYPFKFLVFVILLFIIWRLFDKHQPFYGFSTKQFTARPYFIMLLIMVPLVAMASVQPDFLAMYPKLKNAQFLSTQNNVWYNLLYELAYGCDFFSVELFFRGFLILAFAKWVGKDAILPMALFYCTIHFGKPLGECISSFFGGIILGVITYHTHAIWGGLMVHLGIAWLMELGGYIGNNLIG